MKRPRTSIYHPLKISLIIELEKKNLIPQLFFIDSHGWLPNISNLRFHSSCGSTFLNEKSSYQTKLIFVYLLFYIPSRTNSSFSSFSMLKSASWALMSWNLLSLQRLSQLQNLQKEILPREKHQTLTITKRKKLSPSFSKIIFN